MRGSFGRAAWDGQAVEPFANRNRRSRRAGKKTPAHPIRNVSTMRQTANVLMTHKCQLARWLDKALSLKYLNASFFHPFEMRLSTTIRGSKLLDGYGRPTNAVAAVDAAFGELRTCHPPLLRLKPEKNTAIGARGKILGVVCTLHPPREFVAEAKAASKRQPLAALAKPGGGTGGGQGG